MSNTSFRCVAVPAAAVWRENSHVREHRIFTRHITTQLEIFAMFQQKKRACAVTFSKNGWTWENAVFLCEHHLRENNRVSKGEYPLGSGFPIGASSTLLAWGVQRGTAFPPPLFFGRRFPKEGSAILGIRLSRRKSSVLYLCGADGSQNCSTPSESVATVAAFWRERLPHAGQHKRQKKAGRRCGYALSASRVICGTKVYQSPHHPLFPIVSEPPRQFPTQAFHRLALHLLCPALVEMEMKCRADQRVLDSVGKNIVIQQIGLLFGSQFIQCHIQFCQLFFFYVDLL